MVERLLDNCYKLRVGRKFEVAHVRRLKPWYERTPINNSIIEEDPLDVAVISAKEGASRMMVEVSILDQPMSAPIDTGANACFMSLDQMMYLQLISVNGLAFEQLDQRIRLADGVTRSDAMGKVETSIRIEIDGVVKVITTNVFIVLHCRSH